MAASTVSRAYGRPGRVSPGTAQRVRDAAARLGYRERPTTPTFTRSVEAPTRTLGLVVPDVTNPFFGGVVAGAAEAAHEVGYLLTLSDTGESAQVERATVEQEIAQVDGLVIAGSRMSDSALRMMAKQRPMVLLNRVIPEVGCVVGDDLAGAQMAVEHLAGLGHRSLCYLAGPEAGWADGVRWRGLQQAAHHHGLTVRRIGPHDPTTTEGSRAAARVAAGRATAVVAYDEALAVGLSNGLARLGVDVPGDISVLGFDGTALGAMVMPPLTTITAPLTGMGSTGVRLCLDLATGARDDLPAVVLPVALVTRASTAPPPRTARTPRRPGSRPRAGHEVIGPGGARAATPGGRAATGDEERTGGQLPATVRRREATLRG